MSETATSNPIETKTRKSRNSGPVQFKYKNVAGEVQSKADAPHSIVLTDGKEFNREVLMQALPVEVIHTLAAKGFAAAIDTYVRNHMGGAKSLEELINERTNELIEGKIYARTSSGTGAPKTVDVTLWVEAMRRAQKYHGNAFTDEQASEFEARLIALPGKERKKKIDALMKDVQFRRAKLELEVEREKKAAPKGQKAADKVDLFAAFNAA
jgi:hypothetical protein